MIYQLANQAKKHLRRKYMETHDNNESLLYLRQIEKINQ